ncbi:MAG: HAD-IA family hydrolase [Cocleimonas sp.]|nr:HAD-IA family hydrolase [Cocleimonas sp.]
MRIIKCITFDLDDTLWACHPVIHRAEQESYQWIKTHYPKISNYYSEAQFGESRLNYHQAHPEDQFDFTKTRQDWLAQLAKTFGYSPKMAQDAFHVFWLARNQVTLFNGVTALLERLSKRFVMGTISNGNADIDKIGIGQYFNFSVQVREVGVAKPAPEMFQRALMLAQCQPHEMIHIGDHSLCDIFGALNAGLHAIWLNPQQRAWTETHQPSAIIQDLDEIETHIERIIAEL